MLCDEVLDVSVDVCEVGASVVISAVVVVVVVVVVSVVDDSPFTKDIPSKIHVVTISCISLHFVVYVISDSHRQPI